MIQRIQVNIQTTPIADSKNGKTARYLKERFNGAYASEYLKATKILWHPIAVMACGGTQAEIKAAREESERLWQKHWDDELGVTAAVVERSPVDDFESFDDLEDDDDE
jgi:hypothetical protein